MALLISACSSAQVRTNLSNIWISEAPPMSQVNAGYFTVTNTGDAPMSLVTVSSEDFGRVEMHRSVVENGVAKMIRQEKVEIKGGQSLDFEPGGYHLMLFDARTRLVTGNTATLSFTFSDGSVIESTAEVRPLGGTGHSKHEHH